MEDWTFWTTFFLNLDFIFYLLFNKLQLKHVLNQKKNQMMLLNKI